MIGKHILWTMSIGIPYPLQNEVSLIRLCVCCF